MLKGLLLFDRAFQKYKLLTSVMMLLHCRPFKKSYGSVSTLAPIHTGYVGCNSQRKVLSYLTCIDLPSFIIDT